jgi:serine protease AprX
MNATSVWAEGYYGQGSLVAIIDTGIYSGHFMFNRTSIVGGIDISYDNHTRYGIYPPEYEGWDNIRNSPHGSHVAGILASTGGILVSPVHPLAVAIERYAGISLPTYGPYKVISLLGIAPNADLYIIKVFDHTSRGIPASIVIEAIEHAITLKVDEILDVDVISMSLGGPTLYDGRALLDRTVDVATEVGITVVSAAGNSGPASMTIASPGSAHTSITAGLAAHPVNTRVFWDYYFGIPEIGYSLYKADVPQIHWFGSRGPTSDGRLKPTVSATGTFILSAYPSVESPQRLAFATGTSMSTPAVSGAVALLNSYAEANLPAATPEDYRQAITSSADWLEGYTEWDQGAGYLNAGNALSALKADTSIGDVAEPLPPTAELMDITNIPIVGSGVYITSIVNLEPGHKIDFIFEVTEPTEMIRLEFTNVVVGENPYPIAQMIFPNSFEVYIQSAKRTFTDYYVYSANVIGKSWFKITDGVTLWKGATFGGFSLQYVYPPVEPGYVKITIESDWTNYVSVSADIKIKVTELEPQEVFTPDITIGSQIEDGEWIGWMIIPIPAGTQVAKVELWWTNGWNKYPTSDLDVYIFVPDVGMNHGGATLNSPEKVDVDIDGATWFAFLLHGYAIYTGEPESFELRIYFK